MRKSHPTHEGDKEAPKPGSFMPDGSWNNKSEINHRGHIHQLVVALCRERRTGRISPNKAANTILAANAMLAFPNFNLWSQTESWPLTLTTTGAEEAVKRAGGGIIGHWCGERWELFAEKDCGEPRHHDYPAPAEVTKMLGKLMASLPDKSTHIGIG